MNVVNASLIHFYAQFLLLHCYASTVLAIGFCLCVCYKPVLCGNGCTCIGQASF